MSMIVSHNGLEEKRNKFASFFKILIIVCVLWNSNSFYITIDSTIGVLLLAFAIILTLISNKIRLTKNDFFVLAVLVISSLLSMIINNAYGSFGTTIRFSLTIIAAYLLAKTETVKTFSDRFIKAMAFLTIVSLIPFILINYLGIDSFLYKLPVYTNVNGASVHSALLFNFYTNTSSGVSRASRNMSIFWEPAIYASYCGLAIALELAFKKKIRPFLVITCALGILSSRSTGGYLLLGLLFVLLVNVIFLGKNKRVGLDYILVFGLLLVFGIVIISYNNIVMFLNRINPDIFYKLIPEKNSSSLTTRANSAFFNLQLFMEKPIFGYGIGNVDNYYVNMGGHNQTSTLSYYLSAFGIFGLTYSIVFLIGIFQQKIRFSTKLILLIILLFVLLKEPYYFSFCMHLLIFTMIINRKEETTYEKNIRINEKLVFQR